MNYRIGSFKIADWIVYPDLNRISGPKGEQIVGPRIMQLLVYLAQQEGGVVTREDLLTHVWDDVHVNEESITKSISILRNAFEATSEKVPVIETIRSIGYRLVLPVEFDIVNSKEKEKSSPLVRIPFRNRYAQLAIGALLIVSFVAVYAFDVLSLNTYAEPVAVSKLPGVERVPRISPDGNWMVFAWDGPGTVNYDIFIKNLETSELVQLTSGGAIDTDPIWSPDGSHIAFYRNDGENITVQSVNIETGFTNRVANANQIPDLSAMTWSPDSKYIVFSDRVSREQPFSLFILDYETGIVEKLTSPDMGLVGDLTPRFSGDNRYVAFLRGRTPSELFGDLVPAIGDIMILDLETDSLRQVTHIDTEISGLDWESGTNTILFSSIANNFIFRINKLDVEEEEFVILHETNHVIRNLSSNPKRRLMAYEQWREEVIFKKLDLNGDSFVGVNYISDSNRQWYPQLSKDETKLSYVSVLSGTSELWVKDLNSDTERQLTFLNGPVIHKPRWSPDGQWIAFCTEDKVGTQVHIISAVEENARVTTFMSDFTGRHCLPNWSEDGKSFYFRTIIDTQGSVWKARLSSDYSLVVDTTKVLDARTLLVEEKGDYLYYSKGDANGIWKFNKSTQEDTQIIPDFRAADWANWELKGQFIYYYYRDEYGRVTLMKYDLDEGTKEPVHSFLVNLPWIYAGFTYSKSENQLIFSSANNVSSEVMMMSFK